MLVQVLLATACAAQASALSSWSVHVTAPSDSADHVSLGSVSSSHLYLAEHVVLELSDLEQDALCTLFAIASSITDIETVDDADNTVTAFAVVVVLGVLDAAPSRTRSPEAATEATGATLADAFLTAIPTAVTAAVIASAADPFWTLTPLALTVAVTVSATDAFCTRRAVAVTLDAIALEALPSLTTWAEAVVANCPAAVAAASLTLVPSAWLTTDVMDVADDPSYTSG